jgi:hypothetical protein
MAKSKDASPNTPGADTNGTAIVGRTRSPNYPIYRIDTALKKTEALAAQYKRFRVPLQSVAETMGFKSHTSSSAAQAVAALKAYGFVDVSGNGDSRQVAVSETAHKIIGNHTDRQSLLQKAALAPAIHLELYKKFVTQDGIAPDATIRQFLLWDREGGRFNEDVVDVFIRQFKGTLQFVGLDTSAKMSKESSEPNPAEIEIGDLVQWESQGVAQFAEPKRVASKSPDGAWVFVDDSPVGLAIAEVRRVEPQTGKPPMHESSTSTVPSPGSTPPPQNPNFKPPVAPGFKEYFLTVDTGTLLLRWPESLSDEDYETVEGWLEAMKRKIKRSVQDEGQAKN